MTPKTATPTDSPAGYGPADIQSAYHLPAASGHPTVAIIDAYDDPTAESDLAVYRSQFGLPECSTANGCFRKVNQNGQATPLPAPNNDWIVEISLDVDAVSAACPACHILLVETDDNSWDNLFTGVDSAVRAGAKFVSMSFAGQDGSWASTYDSHFDVPGVEFAAATGDFGYDAGSTYPSTSPFVTAVGGTSLTSDPSTARGWTESAWDGAQSGCSSDETAPDDQLGVTPCSTKGTADISADADPSTGLAVYDTSADVGWDLWGGTSLATPLITAMYAIAGDPGPNDRPSAYPYEHPTGLNDVTSGSNGTCEPAVLCTAGTGWDGPTGLGTPAGISALQPPTGADDTVILNASPNSSSGFGQKVTFSARVSSAVGTPAGQVAFRVNGLPVVTRTLPSSGDVSFSTAALPPGDNLIVASYSGDGTHPRRSASVHYSVTCDHTIAYRFTGSVNARSGSTCIVGSTVRGAISVASGASLALLDTAVAGAVTAVSAPGMVMVCDSSTGGALDVVGATALVMVGDPGVGCGPNTVSGALLAIHNHNGVEIQGNRSLSVVATDDYGPGPYPGMSSSVSANHLL